MSGIIEDNARSFCQLSSNQIDPPACHYTLYTFFCMYSWESLKSSVWPRDRDVRVWADVSCEMSFLYSRVVNENLILSCSTDDRRTNETEIFLLLLPFYILRIDKQWNEWDKIWRFLDALKFDPCVAGSECTMDHEPWSWTRAWVSSVPRIKVHVVAGWGPWLDSTVHWDLWGLARGERGTQQLCNKLWWLLQHLHEKMSNICQSFRKSFDLRMGCWALQLLSV